MHRTRTAFALVFFVLLLDVMGLTLLFPVATFLVRRYSEDALHVALVSAIYAAGQFCAAPALGYLSDRVGRRPVLIWSVLGAAAGYVVFGVGGALWVLFLGRAIAGVTGGSISTATAYIADLSRPEDRPRNFALVGVAWGVGLVIGPLVGGVAGDVRLELPAFIAAGLSLASAALCFFLLPESLPPERRDRSPFRVAALNPLGSVVATFRRPEFVLPLVALCLFNLGFQGINATEGLYLIERFGVTPKQLGVMMIAVGFVIAAVQGVGARTVIPRHGEKRTAVAALTLHAGAAVAALLPPSFLAVLPVILFRNAASGFVFPSLGGLVSKQARDEEQGRLMGVTSALQSLMSALGPAVTGVAHRQLFSGAGYCAGAALVALAAIAAARLRTPARAATASPAPRARPARPASPRAWPDP